MKSYLRKLKKAEKKFTATANYLKDRNTWINLLNTLQQCLPDNTWIVELAPTQQASKTVVTRARRSIFGRKKVTTKKPKNITSNDWIELKAHSLVLSKYTKITSAEMFKNNLLKAEIFSDNPNEIIIVDFSVNPNEANNIDTFNMKIKLKKKLPNK